MTAQFLPSPRDPFIARLRRMLVTRKLVRPGDGVLVACSGGADSTALVVGLAVLAPDLDLVLRLGHVNHCLRGAEADEDARRVRDLARRLGLPFHLGVAHVAAIRAERGGSIEEVARWARLRLLRDMAGASDLIATAHHADDQAETVLLHLLRGSGLEGLAGMAWGPEDGIIRPFLGFERREIHDALVRWGMSWREDESNRSLEFARNRLRHELIPELAAQWNARIVPALARLAEIVAGDEAALEAWVERTWGKVTRLQTAEVVVLDRVAAGPYPLGIKRRLVRRAAYALRTVREPLSYAETDRLVRLLDERGDVVLRGRMIAWSGDDAAWFEAADAWRGPTVVGVPGRTNVTGWGSMLAVRAGGPEADVATALVWPEGAFSPPLVIRRWRPGDRIAARPKRRPDLVADLARKRKPPIDPRGVLVLADAQRIIWAVGVATAELPPTSLETSLVAFRWERGRSREMIQDE